MAAEKRGRPAVSKKAAPKKKTAPARKGTASKNPPKKAAAKPKPRASAARKKRPQATPPPGFKAQFYSLMVTLVLILAAAAAGYVLLHPQQSPLQLLHPKTPAKTAAEQAVKPLKITQFKKPEFEIFPIEPIPPRKSSLSEKPVAIPEDRLPKVALIIDDLGYNRETDRKFINLGINITCAILPKSEFGAQTARLAEKNGLETMLHQPMEPNEYPGIDPGPGALLAAMAPDERIAILKANLDALPGIKGVNNHMGSKLTTLSDEMNQVFTVLKQRRLFFIDSRTTAATQTRSSARLFKVPFAERDVFIDHVRTRESIRKQIEALINIAQINGRAVGIGHPHEITYEVLKEMLPQLRARVELVPASKIVAVP